MAVTYKRRIRSSQSAEWACLIGPALFSILDMVLEPIDHVHFATFWEEWLAVAKKYNHVMQSWRKAFRKEKSTATLSYPSTQCRITERRDVVATVDLPDESRQAITVLNPFNQAMAPIPLHYRLPVNHLWSCLPTIVLSALNPDSYVVLAIDDRVEKLAFIKEGHQRWTSIEGHQRCECNYLSVLSVHV